MSFLTEAHDHLLGRLAENGVELTDKVRRMSWLILKDKLFRVEQQIFTECMRRFDERPTPAPPYTAKDLTIYRAGAFNLAAMAPGGIVEVDSKGVPVSWERQECEVCIMDGTRHSIKACTEKRAKTNSEGDE